MNEVSLIGRPMLSDATAIQRTSNARWLITFADLAAVMVAFFVLLFSMAEVDSDKWHGAVTAFDRQFRISDSLVTPRPIETENITQRLEAGALDLRYLERVVVQQLKERAVLNDMRSSFDGNRLVLRFPANALFDDGAADLNASGREILFLLGNAFAGVENRLSVTGHTLSAEPQIEAGGASWELALARAAMVGQALRATGYSRPIALHGRSGARGAGSAAQRIDIVIRADAGEKE